MFKKLVILSFFVTLWVQGYSQYSYAPLSRWQWHWLDKIEIEKGRQFDHFHSSIKPYNRQWIFNEINPINRHSLLAYPAYHRYLLQDQSELDTLKKAREGKYKLLAYFYPTKNAYLAVDDPEFQLVLNPVFHFEGSTSNGAGAQSGYRNTRGINVRGSVGKKIGFQSSIIENQWRPNQYEKNRIANYKVLPGVGFIKPFGVGGYDYFDVRGSITFAPIKQVTAQFGHDQNFVGNGYRSLVWSDNAPPNLFLKLNTKVWRINYMNLFSKLADFNPKTGRSISDPKYSAFHHLSINLGKNLNVGFFEMVLFDTRDSTQGKGFQPDYANPVIFYRAIEHQTNSAHNVLLGMDWKWNFLRRFSLYGQLVLDEFKINEIRSRNGWWANKWALQTGLKYIKVAGINNLDLQLEANIVRPYTFAHYETSQSATNYGQALGHPNGANFYEGIAILRYQPFNQWMVKLQFHWLQQGVDSSLNQLNYGANLNRDYRDQRPMDYGNTIAQGVSELKNLWLLEITYHPWHNVFIYAGYRYFKQTGDVVANHWTEGVFSAGLRYNFFNRQEVF